jgi:Ca2+ transporting ATPase
MVLGHFANGLFYLQVMWRSILGQAVLQLALLFVVLFYGYRFWQVESYGPVHMTLVFNVFVLLQLVNIVNSRKCNGELNVFTHLVNPVFIGVLVFNLTVSYLFLADANSALPFIPPGMLWCERVRLGCLSRRK